MNALKFYGTKSKKALDKIKELEKEVVEFIADRDRWVSRYEFECRNINDLKLKVDAMQTAIDGQKELADNLLAKNKELVAQIHELEKRPQTEKASPVNEVQLSLDGAYTVVFDRNKCKVIGVAK